MGTIIASPQQTWQRAEAKVMWRNSAVNLCRLSRLAIPHTFDRILLRWFFFPHAPNPDVS